MPSRTIAALAPLVVLVLGLVVWVLVDLARHPRTRVLPAWAWALLSCLSFPLGIVAYVTVGRDPQARS